MRNERFLKALRREVVDRTPIWIMRQAGRYLPEYRKLRAQVPDFLTFCKTPELACQATLQPITRYEFDAAIIFSDILTIPDAMGLGLVFEENYGPKFAHPLRDLAAIKKLRAPEIERDLGYVMKAIKMTKKELQDKVPLLGFSGSPWTLATYMVEGGSSKNFSHIRGLMYRDPQALSELLEILTQSITDYLLAQVAAGADAVMIFDTWGGILPHQEYLKFSLAYIEKIVAKLNEQQVLNIVFVKNSFQYLPEIKNISPSAISLDWMTDMRLAKAVLGDDIAVQGNMDPAVLYAEPAVIRAKAQEIMTQFGTGPGHIFNLGHGIYPDIDPDKVAVLVEAVRAGI